MRLAGGWIGEPESVPGIEREDDYEDKGHVEEEAMNVLEDQRKRAFATVSFSRLANGTGRRIGPECFVVGATIVVAGQAESAGCPEDK